MTPTRTHMLHTHPGALFPSRIPALLPATLAALLAVLPLVSCSSRPSVRPLPAAPDPSASFAPDLSFEPILPGAMPPWWADEPRIVDGAVEVCAIGYSTDLRVAYNFAAQNARNAARVVLSEPAQRVTPVQGVYAHLLSGQYRVMLQARCEGRTRLASPNSPAPTPIPNPTPTPSPNNTPVVPLSVTGAADQPEPSPESVNTVPAWYSESPTAGIARLTVGATAEGATLRDARRQAVAAARAKLAVLLTAEPRDVQTPRVASQRLPDGRFRVYVLASAAETTK